MKQQIRTGIFESNSSVVRRAQDVEEDASVDLLRETIKSALKRRGS